MYRLEDNVVLRSATANFNDKRMAKSLEELFDGIFLSTNNVIKDVDLTEYFLS